jgi:predicted nuclease of predicted toxin-antitoxin system
MRFFVDENVPSSIVSWLTIEGHDVLIVPEPERGELDEHWLQVATVEQRLVLTSDKDFGELIYQRRMASYGVVLLRMGNLPVPHWIERLKETWAIIEANPLGRFIVITPYRVRVRIIGSS